MLETLTQWDTRLFLRVNNDWTAPWLDTLMPVLSCVPLLWILAGLALSYWTLRALWRRDPAGLRRMFYATLFLALCLGATNTLTDLTKKWGGRVRPYNSVASARYYERDQWKQRPPGLPTKSKNASSFFSGHAANTMALAVGLSALCPPAAPVAYLLPASVGYSRLYLGKHYPADVVVGWLAGWLVAGLIRRIARRTGLL